MQAEPVTFEWEYSKENVQPLRGGRKVDAIKKGLAKPPSKGLQVNASFDDLKRQEYENQIKNYKGEDPLSLWIEYIHWVEQTFPSGGIQSEALTLYEKCTLTFKDTEKYKNDERYIRIWLKYADMCNDPADIFTFLDANNIGTKHVVFYHHWALYYEHRGLLDKASKIYELAIQKGAEPVEKMKKKQRAFQARFMEHMKKKMEEMKFEDNNKSLNLNGGSTVGGPNPEDENRTPLGALRPATSAPQTTTAAQPRPTTTVSAVRLPQSQGLAARAKATTVTPVNILKPANNGSRAFNVFVDDEFSEKKPQALGAALKIPSMPASSSFAIPSLPASKPTNPALAMPPGLGFGSNTNATSAPKPLAIPQPVFKNLAPEREKQKENTDLPSKWTDAKMVQSEVKPQLPKIKNKNETEFDVFVDEELVNQPKPQTSTDLNIRLRLEGSERTSASQQMEDLKNNPLKNFTK
eukprot:TRINITY_DN2437_c0_g3_i1.p1 TRINITY_DN2437_c0_g3~~TRINITY_DN2437_c0_g3_i1.p1  ORF type:complete len:465 (+),score=93.30 TRINITY_DN2437_c0_g3_i1:117-1511(+)